MLALAAATTQTWRSMAYNTLYNLSDLINQYNLAQGGPTATESAAELYKAVKQLQQFLITFLSTSFDAKTNKLKDASVPPGAIALGSLTPGVISGTISGADIATGTIPSAALDMYDPSSGSGGAVVESVIDDDAIVTRHIKNVQVTGAKIASGTMLDANFANNTISGSRLLDATVGGEKIQDLDGGVIDDATVTPAKLTPGTAGDPGVPTAGTYGLLVTSSAAVAPATVGGALAMTYDAGTGVATFSLATAGAEGIAVFHIDTSGASVASTWTTRTGWVESYAYSGVTYDNATGEFEITEEGMYLAVWELAGYAVGAFQSRINDGSAPSGGYGTSLTIPAATSGVSSGHYVFEVETTPVTLTVQYLAQLVDANGLGYVATVAGMLARHGKLTIMKLS